MKTIGVDLMAGQARGAQQNFPTIMRPAMRDPRVLIDPRDAFLVVYDRIAARCREVEEPGLAVIAVEERTGRAAGLVRLCARVDRHVAAIVGRHDKCDLYLTGSDELALRHLAIVLHPVTSWRRGDTGIRFGVFDLRTHSGFSDEANRNLRGIKCEGPAILRCGDHILFALPLGDPTDWPTDARDAWGCLPERVYLDEAEHLAQASLPSLPQYHYRHGVPGYAAGTRRSMIIRTPGPRDTSQGLIPTGEIAGVLELVGPSYRVNIPVGPDALRDGVLVGRYARCEGAAGLADDASLSRVHAMLVHIDEQLLMIDTGSTNGTWEHGLAPRSRVFTLDPATELLLGKQTRSRWRWLT